jgi:hypothetical protein
MEYVRRISQTAMNYLAMMEIRFPLLYSMFHVLCSATRGLSNIPFEGKQTRTPANVDVWGCFLWNISHSAAFPRAL